MATGKDILNKAISHLGETGTPTWSWWNKSVQNWGTGWAWCCAFVNKVFVECGAGKLFYGGGKTASVGIADNWFYAHCKWVTYSEAQPGDIVIFTWYPTGAGNTRSGREKSHIGIWEKRISDSTFSAIEGNTGNSPAHVMRRTRSRNYIYAIYRPAYTAAPKPIPVANGYTGVYPSGTLKWGSKGTQVKNLQKFLNWTGLSTKLTVDGVWGAKTEAYVNVFCKKVKLVSSTNKGRITWGSKCTAKAKAYRK